MDVPIIVHGLIESLDDLAAMIVIPDYHNRQW